VARARADAREGLAAARFVSCLVKGEIEGALNAMNDAYHRKGAARRGASRTASPLRVGRRTVRVPLLRSKGFDERFFCYIKDVDLGFFLRLPVARAF